MKMNTLLILLPKALYSCRPAAMMSTAVVFDTLVKSLPAIKLPCGLPGFCNSPIFSGILPVTKPKIMSWVFRMANILKIFAAERGLYHAY